MTTFFQHRFYVLVWLRWSPYLCGMGVALVHTIWQERESGAAKEIAWKESNDAGGEDSANLWSFDALPPAGSTPDAPEGRSGISAIIGCFAWTPSFSTSTPRMIVPVF